MEPRPISVLPQSSPSPVPPCGTDGVGATHLGEDEDAVVVLVQHVQHLAQQVELAARLDERRTLVHPVAQFRRLLHHRIYTWSGMLRTHTHAHAHTGAHARGVLHLIEGNLISDSKTRLLNTPISDESHSKTILRTHVCCGGEEVGVVAALLEIHHDVEQRHVVRALRVQRLEVARQDVLVVLPESRQDDVTICLSRLTTLPQPRARTHTRRTHTHTHTHTHTQLMPDARFVHRPVICTRTHHNHTSNAKP